jgi:hypothetical protein
MKVNLDALTLAVDRPVGTSDTNLRTTVPLLGNHALMGHSGGAAPPT